MPEESSPLARLIHPNKPPAIPDKLYFRIGEVSRLVGVPHHVLRYWEKEFPSLAPKKSESSHRLYRRKDVELLLEIKHLLYDRRFTIEGARSELGASAPRKRAERRAAPAPPPATQEALFASAGSLLRDVRQELLGILDMLK